MDEKITITLSQKQRDLLVKYESSFNDSDLFRRISIALKKGKEYEICLSQEQLEDLIDELFGISVNETNEKQVYQLEELCDYLEEFRDYEDEEEEDH